MLDLKYLDRSHLDFRTLPAGDILYFDRQRMRQVTASSLRELLTLSHKSCINFEIEGKVGAIFFDFDKEKCLTLGAIQQLFGGLGEFAYVAYPGRSWTPEEPYSWHVIVPLSDPLETREAKKLLSLINYRYLSDLADPARSDANPTIVGTFHEDALGYVHDKGLLDISHTPFVADSLLWLAENSEALDPTNPFHTSLLNSWFGEGVSPSESPLVGFKSKTGFYNQILSEMLPANPDTVFSFFSQFYPHNFRVRMNPQPGRLQWDGADPWHGSSTTRSDSFALVWDCTNKIFYWYSRATGKSGFLTDYLINLEMGDVAASKSLAPSKFWEILKKKLHLTNEDIKYIRNEADRRFKAQSESQSEGDVAEDVCVVVGEGSASNGCDASENLLASKKISPSPTPATNPAIASGDVLRNALLSGGSHNGNGHGEEGNGHREEPHDERLPEYGNRVEAAIRIFTKHFPVILHTERKNGIVWSPKDRVWKSELFSNLVADICGIFSEDCFDSGKPISDKALSDLAKGLREYGHSSIFFPTVKKFPHHTHLIGFKNGIFDTRSRELIPWIEVSKAPLNYIFYERFDVDFLENHDPRHLQEFLSLVSEFLGIEPMMSATGLIDKHTILTFIRDWLGFALCNKSHEIHRVLQFVGVGGSGKTSLALALLGLCTANAKVIKPADLDSPYMGSIFPPGASCKIFLDESDQFKDAAFKQFVTASPSQTFFAQQKYGAILEIAQSFSVIAASERCNPAHLQPSEAGLRRRLLFIEIKDPPLECKQRIQFYIPDSSLEGAEKVERDLVKSHIISEILSSCDVSAESSSRFRTRADQYSKAVVSGIREKVDNLSQFIATHFEWASSGSLQNTSIPNFGISFGDFFMEYLEFCAKFNNDRSKTLPNFARDFKALCDEKYEGLESKSYLDDSNTAIPRWRILCLERWRDG